MRIGFITEVYPPETAKGGIGTYTKELAEELAERGHEIHVFSKGKENSSKRCNGVKVHRKVFRESQRVISILKFSYWAAKKAGIKNLEIVESPNYRSQGLFVPYLTDAKQVVRICTPSFKDEQITMSERSGLKKIESGIRFYLERIATEKSDFVISISQSNLDLISEKYELPENTIIPCGISDPLSKSSESSEKRKKEILYVGRLDKRKNPEAVIDSIPYVCDRLEGTHYTFVGNTDEQKKRKLLDRLPEEHIDCVSFEGYVSREKLNKIYARSDIFVAPSIYESFGMVYIEAMAHELPVIGTDRGSGEEIIEVGESVDPESVDEISEALIETLSNNLEKSSRKARKTYENKYSVELMADRTLEVYNNLINS